ncbi:PTS transporter subunit EIIB [Mesoplasma melaleucae]|uniref:PTS transporter subunit EIIB n=1 Tax=Mesoplasma melaleucae TaxID=81459 RepID=UPI00048292BA|nr:PTS transporter subunit EIIB [Mesoplasma melaleucae]
MNKINNNNRIDLLNFKSKYYTISLQINELVGGKENYEKVYNCITRVRFKIKDKSKVKIDKLKNDKLKKINLVKGVV